MESFSEFGLSDQILANLEEKGYSKPTNVQAQAIPAILSKKDLVIQSHTGSGKTASFGLPLLNSVMADVPAVQFLILVPTRELAAQVRDEFLSIVKGTKVKVCAIYGGADMKKQITALRDGAQVVIGTPGRIIDHLKRRTMSFSIVRGVVLDESDKMLSMGFLPDVQLILSHLPKRRQMIMSSATFPFTVEQLIYSYMDDPVKLLLSSDEMAPDGIEHQFCTVKTEDKEKVLLALLEKEQPQLSLIFCNTRADVKTVQFFLSKAGLKVDAMSSDLSQNQRERVLKKLRTGQIQNLVCTDLAARGIDINNLTHVFMYSASTDAETYVHRAGRTGRAGNKGKAISLISTLDLSGFRNALKVNDIDADEIQVPTEDEIVSSRISNHLAHLNTFDFGKDTDVREEFSGLAEQLTAEQATSMLPLLLEHFFRPEIIVPPEVPPKITGEDEAADNTEERSSSRSRDRNDRGDRSDRSRGRSRGRDRNERSDRNDRGDRSRSRNDRSRDSRSRDSRSRDDRPRDSRSRDDRPRDSRSRDDRPSDSQRSEPRASSKSFTTICLALGRMDGLDEMDLQSIVRRQGKARMDDIGDIVMKDHESFIDIGSNSLPNVLAADGKYYKNFELFVGEAPVKEA